MDTLTRNRTILDEPDKTELERNLRAARSTATTRAYKRCWDRFAAWCDERGVKTLPAEPFSVAMFLSVVGKDASKATVKQYAAAISAAHAEAGFESPLKHEGAKKTVAGHARRHAKPARQARGIDV